MVKHLNNEAFSGINSNEFRDAYLANWDKLYMYAYNILKDKKVCEDLVQDIFFSLWKNRNTSKINNISAYLFQSLKFQIYKYFRDTKFVSMDLERFYNIIEVSATPLETMAFKDLEDMVSTHTANLPKRCQEIFYLSRFECLSHKEISEKLNISIRTVKNQISVALKYLRVQLEEQTYMLLLIVHLLFF